MKVNIKMDLRERVYLASDQGKNPVVDCSVYEEEPVESTKGGKFQTG
jgi:hypothetical protein